MNILYINPDPPSTYRYYNDLYEQLRKIANCEDGKPDVVVYGLNWLSKLRPFLPTPQVPQVCFVHKIGLDWERKEKFLKTCDLVLSSVPKLPIKHKLFKYGVDPKVFYDRGEKIFDFGFSGALHNEENYTEGTFKIPNMRKQIQELARTQTDLSLFLNGSDDIKPRITDYEKYAEVLSQSKIWLASTGPNGDIGPRYYEVQASKTLLFCDPPPDEYRRTFRNGQNCVYVTPETFIVKLRYYLENEDKRNQIINLAYNECLTNHTWRARAMELVDICSTIKSTKPTKITPKTK